MAGPIDQKRLGAEKSEEIALLAKPALPVSDSAGYELPTVSEVLREQVRAALIGAAASLDQVPENEQVVLGIVLFYAGALLVLNLLVDVAYAWLDPRVELA